MLVLLAAGGGYLLAGFVIFILSLRLKMVYHYVICNFPDTNIGDREVTSYFYDIFI